MKILVINGSPRGECSNTLRVTNAFLRGMARSADISVETVDISKMDIRPCLGCFCCWSKTPGRCVINDDVRSVTLKILAADLVIYSFPLFYYSVPSRLKALIERQLPTVAPFMTGQSDYLVNGGHPPRFEIKQKTILVSTCGFYPTDKSYDAVRAQFDMICGKGNYLELFLGEGELLSKRVADRRCNARLDLFELAGEEYGRTGTVAEETKAKLGDYIFPPDMYAVMADDGWGVTMENFRKADEETIEKVAAESGKEIKTIY